MPSKLPASDTATVLDHDENARRRDALELDLLETDLDQSKAVTDEIKASIAIKYAAVSIGAIVVLVFFSVLGFALWHAIWIPTGFGIDNVAVAIALIVAPITSITAVVIALFIGAFRKYNEKDIQTAGRGISEALMKAYGGNFPGS